MMKDGLPPAPTSDEFTRTLGQVTWLMTLSRPHLERPVGLIRDMVLAPLMLRQLRVYMKDKQPVAAISWAYASPAVRDKIASPPFVMQLSDWRSGAEPVIVECISPLVDQQMFINRFQDEIAQAQSRTKSTNLA
jgi:hemolysin-activating ACP:hemolysin acyltransferase